MKIQIFIINEEGDRVVADRRFEIVDNEAPENIRDSINEMIDNITHVDERF